MNLEFLQQFCLSLPACVEDVKYGSDLCYSVGGKIFLGTRLQGPFRTGIKCTPEIFAQLTEREGIVPMPRLANTGWVRIEKGDALTKKEWEDYITQSYQLIVVALPKKKKNSLRAP